MQYCLKRKLYGALNSVVFIGIIKNKHVRNVKDYTNKTLFVITFLRSFIAINSVIKRKKKKYRLLYYVYKLIN